MWYSFRTDANTAVWWQVGWGQLLIHVGHLNMQCASHHIMPRMMEEENCDYCEGINGKLLDAVIDSHFL
jgi:hypothetical protein